MIVDTLDNLEKYVSLNPLIKEVIDFLKTNSWQTTKDGRHLIKDNEVFVNVLTQKGKSKEEAEMEFHRRMLDIHVPVNTAETHGYIPQEDMPEADYNEDTDMAILSGVPSQMFVTVKPGQFVIFMPQDGHAPGISDQPELRKAIFKVKV